MANSSAGIRVLLAGATGLVGGHCLSALLADDAFSQVTVFSRRPLTQTHPKLTVQILDFERLRDYTGLVQTDAVLCCLGTTHRAAGSPEAFAKVDHIYVAELARLAAARGASRFILVSAVGADPASPVFYHRVKGRAEARSASCILKPFTCCVPRCCWANIPNPAQPRTGVKSWRRSGRCSPGGH